MHSLLFYIGYRILNYFLIGLPGDQGSAIDISTFRRKLRILSHQARKEGHQVIGDERGYYMALTKEEWNKYKIRRFRAIKDELESIVNCDRMSTQDLIKFVYLVKVEDPIYMLNY